MADYGIKEYLLPMKQEHNYCRWISNCIYSRKIEGEMRLDSQYQHLVSSHRNVLYAGKPVSPIPSGYGEVKSNE